MRLRNQVGGATIAVILGVSLFGAAQGDDRGGSRGDDSSDEARIRIGYDIAPVPLNLRGKNRALVGLGSYIMNAQGGCNDCHTHPTFAAGGDPYLGQPEVINSEEYLTGGRQFGPFTSANLTPDEFGRPAGLTFEEFKNAIRTGDDPDGARPPLPPKLQVMPWPVYAKMSNRDLRAIYEFLRAIPSRPDNPNPGP
ncbi:MAG: cytochrome C [bacterium]